MARRRRQRRAAGGREPAPARAPRPRPRRPSARGRPSRRADPSLLRTPEPRQPAPPGHGGALDLDGLVTSWPAVVGIVGGQNQMLGRAPGSPAGRGGGAGADARVPAVAPRS